MSGARLRWQAEADALVQRRGDGVETRRIPVATLERTADALAAVGVTLDALGRMAERTALDVEALHAVSHAADTAEALDAGYAIMPGRFVERGAWRVDHGRRVVVAHDLDVETLRHRGDPLGELHAILGSLVERASSRLATAAEAVRYSGRWADDRTRIRVAAALGVAVDAP